MCKTMREEQMRTKPNLICPTCGGEKFRYSYQCRQCSFKRKIKNENSKWVQNKAKDKNYDKVLCPKCEVNYKARTAIVCYQCNLEKRREGRQGPQYCYRCGSQLTKANWPTHRRK